jgi:serine/threonine protein kinase
MSDPTYSTKAPDDASQPAPGRWTRVPAYLGGYRIVKQLGQGGMGVVYRAEDEQLRRPVALKVMRADIAAHEEARARFLREARAAAALKHDHIVTIYQVGEDQGVPFLAMEFLQGKSLEDWLRPDRRATVPETLAIGKQIAKGLAAAHAVKLIHRDIKPANIWLEAPKGRVKILDFGLARHTAGELTALTQDGAVLGTPAFMAPEQARGDVCDARCDLFSFGCVLYRMTTGRLPFRGNSAFAVLSAIASDTPTPVRELNPNVPPQLAGLVAKLLAKKPDDRPASAQAVSDELSAIEKETKQQGATPTIAIEAAATESSPLARWRWPALAVGLLLVALTIALIARNRSDENEPDPNPKSLPNAAAPAALPRTVELLKTVDLNAAELRRGDWVFDDGRLVGEPRGKDKQFAIVLPWEPPADYCLKLTVMRRSAGGSVDIGLARGAERFDVIFDVPGKAKEHFYSGVGSFDGNNIPGRAELKKRLRVFPPGALASVVCTIKSNQLHVEVDGRPVMSYDVNLKRLGRINSLFADKPLTLGGWNATVEFRDVLLEPLDSDVGKPLPP